MVRKGSVKHKAIPVKSGVGGWLLFFCVGRCLLSPILATFNVSGFWREVGLDLMSFEEAVIVSSLQVFETIVSIYVGVLLWQIKPNALKWTKVYLVTGFSLAVIMFFLGLIALGFLGFARSTLAFSIESLKFAVSCAVWYAYFRKSKRVKATYTS